MAEMEMFLLVTHSLYFSQNVLSLNSQTTNTTRLQDKTSAVGCIQNRLQVKPYVDMSDRSGWFALCDQISIQMSDMSLWTTFVSGCDVATSIM